MSTWWYFECLDHTPPLQAQDEFTQHTEDRHWDHALRLMAQRPVERDGSYWTMDRHGTPTDAERSDAYFDMQARAFLSEHPTCRLGLVNEYDDHRPAPSVPEVTP